MTRSAPGPDYRGVRLKLKRAQTHVNTLSREMRHLRPPELRWTMGRDDWRTATYEGKEPPLRLGVIAGDFAHNARSALDHLIWQLVIASGNNPKGNQFPIYTVEKDWEADLEKRDPSRGPSPLEGVTPEIWNAIRDCQPFAITHRQKDAVQTALWQLHRLSILDKHRVLHVARACMALKTPATAGEAAPVGFEAKLFVKPDQELTPGQKILRWRPVPIPGEGNVRIERDLRVPVTIAFDLGRDSGGMVTVHRIRGILGEITSIIDHLLAAIGQV